MQLPLDSTYVPLPWPPPGYKPEWHQYDMHHSDARFRWLCSGIGGGKTTWAVIEDFTWAVSYPGCTGAIIVPEYRTWRNTVRPEIAKWWPNGVWRETKRDERIEIDCGTKKSVVLIYSASNIRHVEKILGVNLTWMHVEEAGRMMYGEQAWINGTGRLRERVAPKRGAWIAGSPRGFGWLTDAFGIETALPPSAYTHGVVTRCEEIDGHIVKYYVRGAESAWNRSLPKDYHASLLAVYGGDERFVAQELHGKILSQEDMIFYGWSKPLHVIPHEVAMELFRKCPYRHGGVDWGDRTAAMTWGGTTKGGWEEGTVVTIGEYYASETNAETMGAYAHELNKQYGTFRWYCDPAEPGEIRKWRSTGFVHGEKKYGCVEGTVNPSNIPGKKWNQWKAGVDLIRAYMAYIPRINHPAHPDKKGIGGSRWYVSDRCKNLITEIRKYKWAPLVEGVQEKRENAIGLHHAIDTCRYRALGEMMMDLSAWGPIKVRGI